MKTKLLLALAISPLLLFAASAKTTVVSVDFGKAEVSAKTSNNTVSSPNAVGGPDLVWRQATASNGNTLALLKKQNGKGAALKLDTHKYPHQKYYTTFKQVDLGVGETITLSFSYQFIGKPTEGNETFRFGLYLKIGEDTGKYKGVNCYTSGAANRKVIIGTEQGTEPPILGGKDLGGKANPEGSIASGTKEHAVVYKITRISETALRATLWFDGREIVTGNGIPDDPDYAWRFTERGGAIFSFDTLAFGYGEERVPCMISDVKITIE
ncbi:hypothetical protein OH491_04280 [Termitidicoccus mucosus]|uniref:3-keto-disaccharide hydrolase domain-containing protein n=1 Tax=Termitidicoccus mucosus TaxID=1184151 RepID=A0A178IME9_9BACT|nr:hypothetical protein AW736_05320 [Opitutaceae bacterium TSB47]